MSTPGDPPPQPPPGSGDPSDSGGMYILRMAGGFVLGVLASWALAFVVGRTASGMIVALLASAAFGLAVLVKRAWRAIGAGFLAGLAVGAITGAGVCASLFVALAGA